MSIGTPSLIKSNVPFLCIPMSNKNIYFAPDAILVISGRSVAALRYEDVEIVSNPISFIEDDQAPSDAEVVGQRWQYVNKNGTPDRRFSNNRQLPICRYGQLDFRSHSGLNERLQISHLQAANDFALSTVAMRQPTKAAHPRLPDSSEKTPILCSRDSSIENSTIVATGFANETKAARNLALQHGKFWEFLLVDELLKSKLANLKAEYADFVETIHAIPKRECSGSEFSQWVQDHIVTLENAVLKMRDSINVDLPEAMGKPGVSGDALRILDTLNAFFGGCRIFLAFEKDICAIDPPPNLRVIRDDFRGMTTWVIGTATNFADSWSKALEEARKGSHQFNVRATFEVPQLQKVLTDVEELKTHLER